MILGNINIIEHIYNRSILIDPIDVNTITKIHDIYESIQGKNMFEKAEKIMEIRNLIEKHIPQLQGTSYDLTLDKFFVAFKRNCLNTLDPSSQEIYPAFSTKEIINGENGFILHSGQRCLASTMERIGSTDLNITTKIFSKSSWARYGLEVASCAGYGDPGYANHWTLEIFNKNPFSVVLKPGMVIAQISFEKVDRCISNYTSKYNSFSSLKHVYNDDERFEMMLPKKIKVNL